MGRELSADEACCPDEVKMSPHRRKRLSLKSQMSPIAFLLLSGFMGAACGGSASESPEPLEPSSKKSNDENAGNKERESKSVQ